jgi:hypothetical protein
MDENAAVAGVLLMPEPQLAPPPKSPEPLPASNKICDKNLFFLPSWFLPQLKYGQFDHKWIPLSAGQKTGEGAGEGGGEKSVRRRDEGEREF